MRTIEEEYFSINEICQKFKISHSTIYKKIKTGEIPAIKMGRCWKVPKSALERVLYISL